MDKGDIFGIGTNSKRPDYEGQACTFPSNEYKWTMLLFNFNFCSCFFELLFKSFCFVFSDTLFNWIRSAIH
jgi:hypothetical protein